MLRPTLVAMALCLATLTAQAAGIDYVSIEGRVSALASIQIGGTGTRDEQQFQDNSVAVSHLTAAAAGSATGTTPAGLAYSLAASSTHTLSWDVSTNRILVHIEHASAASLFGDCSSIGAPPTCGDFVTYPYADGSAFLTISFIPLIDMPFNLQVSTSGEVARNEALYLSCQNIPACNPNPTNPIYPTFLQIHKYGVPTFSHSGFLVAGETYDLRILNVFSYSVGPGGPGKSGTLDLNLQFIPIPPAVWLFGSALGVMGWMRRKISS